MTKGRKPKPTSIKQMRGNPSKRNINTDEPAYVTGIPDPPMHLDDDALEEWERITGELFSKQVIANVDMAILALYCTTYARWSAQEKMIVNELDFLETPKGYRYVNPRIGLINTLGEKLAKYCAELGITPSSRTRIRTIEKPKVHEDPKKARIKALFGPGVTVAK